jgi:hypothetical protein
LLEKEKNLQRRNNHLIKACNEYYDLSKNDFPLKNKSDYDDYDASFDYYFNSLILEDAKFKSKIKTETILPKVDHIFCIYVINFCKHLIFC